MIPEELWSILSRLFQSMIVAGALLAVAAIMVLSSIGLDFLVALTLSKQSKGYEVVVFAFDVCLIGGAIVVAAAGAIVAAADVIKLAWSYIRGGS